MTAVTAITAQNTLGVTAVHPVPAEMILAQIDAVVGDIGVDAVKIGMIGSAFAAEQVAERLEQLKAGAARPADRLRSGDGRDQRRGAGRRCDHRRLRPADGRRDDRHAQPARTGAADGRGGSGRGGAQPGRRTRLRGADQGRARGRRRARRRADRNRQYDQLAGPADRHHQHARHRLHPGQRDRLLSSAEGATLADRPSTGRASSSASRCYAAPGLGQGAGPIGQRQRPARRRRRAAAQPGDGDRHRL